MEPEGSVEAALHAGELLSFFRRMQFQLVPRDACVTKALTHEGRGIPARDVHAAFLAALDGTYAQVLNADGIIARLSGGAV